MQLASAPGTTRVWSTGDAWGTVTQGGSAVEVVVRRGALRLSSLVVIGRGTFTPTAPGLLPVGVPVRLTPRG